jgi:hypothetical protein
LLSQLYAFERFPSFTSSILCCCFGCITARTPSDSWHNWHNWHNYFPQTVSHLMPISRLHGAKSPLLHKSSRLAQDASLFTCHLVFALAIPLTHRLDTFLMLPERWNIKTYILWFTYMRFTRYFLITSTQLKLLILTLQLHMCDVISQLCAFLCRIFPWRWPRNVETCRRLATWLYTFVSNCCAGVGKKFIKINLQILGHVTPRHHLAVSSQNLLHLFASHALCFVSTCLC